MAAFWRKMVFQNKYKQTLPSSYDVELKLLEFFRKNLASFSKQDSACPDQRFQRNRLKWIFFSVHFFWTLSGNSIDSGRNFSALLSKLHATCLEVQFWDFFWGKTWGYLICCNFLSGKFPEGVSKLLFMTSQEHFETKIFFHFSFLIFSHFQTLS